MKHFTITTQEQAKALRPYYCNLDGLLLRPTIGERVTPSANSATVTSWPDYPEDEAITFEECMAIVRDEVTEDVLRELGELSDFNFCKWVYAVDGKSLIARSKTPPHRVYLYVWDTDGDQAMTHIPNCTATKLRLLVAILRGE